MGRGQRRLAPELLGRARRSAWREKLTSQQPARVNHVWETTPTFTVTVRGAVAQLNDLALFVTGIGPGSSLSAKLAKVQDDLAKGKPACAGLQKVIDEAVKNKAGKLTEAQVSSVVASAQRIKNVLEC